MIKYSKKYLNFKICQALRFIYNTQLYLQYWLRNSSVFNFLVEYFALDFSCFQTLNTSKHVTRFCFPFSVWLLQLSNCTHFMQVEDICIACLQTLVSAALTSIMKITWQSWLNYVFFLLGNSQVFKWQSAGKQWCCPCRYDLSPCLQLI